MLFLCNKNPAVRDQFDYTISFEHVILMAKTEESHHFGIRASLAAAQDYLNRCILPVSFRYFTSMAITGAIRKPANPNSLSPAYMAVMVIMG